MKKILTFLFAVVVISFFSHSAFAADTIQDSAFDRVIKTGELRVSYFSWKPAFIKDPNTGVMSGIFHDYVEELGRVLGLKIVWAEEIGLADYPAALESGRIDIMTNVYVTSPRARAVDFITPAYYVPLHAYARANDKRFDNFTPEKFNKPDYSVAILEGGVTSILQKEMLPQTKIAELPQLTSPADLFVSVAQGKADFMLYDRFTFEDYNARNPGKLKRVTTSPLKVFPIALAIGKKQDALREMLDTATMDLYLAGTIDRIIKKYETYPDSLIRAALPYKQ